MADGLYVVFHRFEAFHRWPVYCWMSIQRPSCFFNLCSSCSSHSNKRRQDCLLPPPRGRLCCRAGLTVVLSARRGQRGQGTTSIGRVLYVERLTAGSMATAQFFVIFQVSRFVRPVGLQIFQDEESFHSAGRENGPSVMRNGLYIFKTHQTDN